MDVNRLRERIWALESALAPFIQVYEEKVRPDDGDNDGVIVKTKFLRAANMIMKETDK